MNKLAIGFVAVTSLIVTPAIAADMAVKAPLYKAPPPPVYTWSGCYIGANVGGAWSHQDVYSSVPLISDQAPGYATLRGSSLIGGGQAGCNWQVNPTFVLGIEGDWSATNLNGSGAFPNLSRAGVPFATGGISYGDDTKWLASIRGRLGLVATPSTLLYVTGGGAWASTNYSGSDIFLGGCPNCGLTGFTSTQTGWVGGLGAEWAPWGNHWTLRVEYLHYDFAGASSTPVRLADPAAPPTFTWNDLSIDEIRTGVSYKF